MKRFRDAVLSLSLRRPRLVVAFWLAVLAGLSVPLLHRLINSDVIVDNSVGIWFLKDDPNLARYERNNEIFGCKEWSIVLLETESVADPVFLRELSKLTDELESLPHVLRVLSLASVRGLHASQGGAPKLAKLLQIDSAEPAESLRKSLASNPELERLLLPKGWGRHTALLIQSDNFLHDLNPYRIELVDAVHQTIERMPGVLSHAFAGTTVINAELNRSAQRDALRFYLLVSLMVICFGWLALRDAGDLAIVLAVLVITVLGTMGAIAFCDLPFNIVTILLPLILVSLSVCDVIHVINAFHGERISRTTHDAAVAAIHRLWTPCLWTSIVTVAGIMSLAASTVVPIRQMGLFTSFGLVLAWACTMTLAPLLLVARWSGRARPVSSSWKPGRYGERVLPLLSGRWRWLWIGVAVLLMVPVAGILRLQVDTDYTRFFAADTPVSQAYQKLKEAGMAQSAVEVVVTAGADGSLDQSIDRVSLLKLEERVRCLPFVNHTLSEAQLIQQIDQGMNGPTTEHRWLSYPDEVVDGMRDAARAAGLSELDEYATSDRSRQRVVVLTDYMSSHELQSFRESVAQIARETLPASADVAVLGTTVLWANMDREIETTQIRSILVLAAVFVVLLPILFRSVRLGLIGILINGVPLAMTFGLMGLLGLRLNMATALIGGVSIGSTVDSTLFFINRFQKEHADGKSWHEAIVAAVRGVGDGILITTMILAGGFLCMSVSSFLPTAHFGMFTCFTILTGAFLDILINPILLGFCGPGRPSRDGVESAS